jgi:hypothetical protein
MTGHGSTSAFPELPVDGWRTAGRCGPNGGNCVEVNLAVCDSDGVVGIRDSKPDNGPALVFDAPMWRSFLADAKGGNFPG